ncbi:WD40/YVTN/BNR-like repeat-containing protein [Halobellus rubicundus]|uniref:WD40/YVTN/BNR-like repeat-containing protein n=1 Tax=Halobellus rubicundus TaxID=2996466 RepID=A0ABD5MHA0_9EURY
MSERTISRRRFLKASSATIAAAAVPATAAAAESGWTVAETPVDGTLHDVEYTAAGAYAVGGGGVVIERAGGAWRKVLDGGPTGNGNNLYGADVTDDGSRLWFVGASGAIGEYDVESGTLADHSAPLDNTNNYNDVAVTGRAGEANVYVAGDSGKIYYSFENGESGTWEYVTPGSGSNVNAVDFYGERAGHLVDGNKSVFRTADGGVWNKAGIADANVNFYGVDADAPDDVWVSGGGGRIFHWNGSEWIPVDTGDAGLRDVEVEGGRGLTVGGGGKAYELSDGRWERTPTPTGANLKAVVRGDRDLAVGAGGIVIER